MMQILTKVLGIRACSDLNGELHRTLPQLWATGHFNSTPHFVLTDNYLSEYTIILVCSFLDEYNEHFIPTNCIELKDRIYKFRKQIKPVLTRMNQWTDLHKYRNIILAHNLRTKGNQSILDIKNEKIDFNIPNTRPEFQLLTQLSILITQNIGVEFPELITKIDLSETVLDKLNVPYELIDFDAEFNVVCEQIKNLGLTRTQ